jgi:NodT family efflux transporter outer membrane factor (OMF) lipoprotein
MNDLVDIAMVSNLNLRVAAANLSAAEATVRSAYGARWPAVSAGISADRRFVTLDSGNRLYADNTGLFLGVSWQADLFGKLRSAENAAASEFLATREDQAALTHTIIASVIRQRVRIDSARQRLELAQSTAASRQNTLDVVDRRHRRGVSGVSAVDVYLARENLSAARADIAARRQEQEVAANALDILLGRKPGSVSTRYQDLDDVPMLDPSIAGVPARLLDRRPDLLAAEFRLMAANERVGVAIADLYPNLALTGRVGTQSGDFADLITTQNLFANAMAELAGTIFSGGRLRAGVDVSRARLEAQAATYSAAVLQAMREVEDALVRNRQLTERIALVRQQAADATQAERLANDRYQNGIENLLTVLETERRRRNSQDLLLLLVEQLWNARINLHLALGGTWIEEVGGGTTQSPVVSEPGNTPGFNQGVNLAGVDK